MTRSASRGELIAGLALLVTVGGGIAYFFQDKGAMQRSIEGNATLMQQRNRENDALRDDVRELRQALCTCGGKQ